MNCICKKSQIKSPTLAFVFGQFSFYSIFTNTHKTFIVCISSRCLFFLFVFFYNRTVKKSPFSMYMKPLVRVRYFFLGILLWQWVVLILMVFQRFLWMEICVCESASESHFLWVFSFNFIAKPMYNNLPML